MTPKESILAGLGIFLFGALVTQLWNRYRTRLRRPRWSDSYHKVAVAGEHAYVGKIKVLYNDNPVENVYTALMVCRGVENDYYR